MFATLSGRRRSSVSNELAQTRLTVEDDFIKRAALKPKSASCSHTYMPDPASPASPTSKYELRAGGEQAGDHNTLRDLAKFFRATPPPSDLGLPREKDPITLNSAGKEPGKRSISSMMKLRRARSPSQSAPSHPSHPAHPAHPAGPSKTSLSLVCDTKSPVLPEIGSPWSQSPYLDFASDFTQHSFDLPEWPERTTSLAALSETHWNQAHPAPPSLPNLFFTSTADISVFSTGLTKRASEVTREPEPLPQAEHSLRGSSLDQDAVPPVSITRPGATRTDPADGAADKSPYLHTPKLRPVITEPGLSNIGVRYPLTPPPSGQLEEFRWPDSKPSLAESTPALTQKSLRERRRESKPTSPKSTRSDSRNLSVVMNPTLTVPKDCLPPESPGFPTMLASMTFPSPPKSTRWSVVDTTATSRPSTASAPASFPLVAGSRRMSKDATKKLRPMSVPAMPRPAVKRQVSSRDATTTPPPTASGPAVNPRASSTALPVGTAASLDEIVMRPARPGLLQSKSDQSPLAFRKRTESNTSRQSTLGDCTPAEAPAEKKAVQAHVRKPSWMHSQNPSAVHRRNSSVVQNQNSSAAHSRNSSAVHSRKPSSVISRTHSRQTSLVDGQPTRPDSAASFFTACEDRRDSMVSLLASETEMVRQSSTWSSSSTTTAWHRQSTWTDDYQHQSTRSDATTISTVPSISDETADGTDVEMPTELPAEELPADGMVSTQPDSAADLPPASIQSIMMNRIEAPRKMSIAERRLIRRTQSSGSEGSIELTVAGMKPPPKGLLGNRDSVDSPILGWFHPAGVPNRKPSRRGPSPLAKNSQTSPPRGFAAEPKTSAFGHRKSLPGGEGPNQWCISSVMAAEIEPDFPSERPVLQAQRLFTVSPVIIVANLEPEAAPPAQSLPAFLTLASLDNTSPPHLPLRSPLRKKSPGRRMSRIQHVPIRIAVTPSNDGHSTLVSRNSTPSMTPSKQNRLSKRMSLPLNIMPPKSGPVPFERRQSQHQQAEQVVEAEPPSPEMPSPEMPSKRRSVIVRERFQEEKTRKERELAEFIAQTTISSSLKTNETDPEQASEDATKKWDEEAHATDELEKRLKRLEMHGDEWLNMLDPVLQNMSHTLKEMKRDGKRSPLLMGEFVVDMASEARRSMYQSGVPEPNDAAKGPIFFEGFDGIHQPATSTAEEVSSRKSRGGHHSSEADQSGRAHHTKSNSGKSFLITENTDEENDKKTSSKQQSRQVPTTQPIKKQQNHELEAQASVERRIQKQEVMMDQLLSRLDLLQPRSPLTPKSPRSPRSPRSPMAFRTGANEVTQSPRSKKSTRSRRGSTASSMVTTRASRTAEEDGLDKSLRALKSAPLTKYWLNKNDKGGLQRGVSRRSSRRDSWKSNKKGSRRWSNMSRRSSWRQGDVGGINALMLELRNTSRLSGEWEDIEVIY